MTTDEEFLLHVERDGPTWKALMEWATTRRANQDDALRRRGVDERESDFHRGKASVYTELLQLNDKVNPQ